MIRFAAAALLMTLAACSDESGSGGLTADESRQLNEAAAMLDDAPAALPVANEQASVEE
ncbi:hypothetical protein [Allosphingosinicella indica]|uniref:Uncharacterized protein n=1 Tax=Allosphingosinicella indica TaxID=941907 RepID=A0A1X7G2M7_9SPHN|nr:hypothetical protein [Allosphingosinicella indica]SMF62942.1 hypothetical protein SAMN06295910_1032 [Allosphingosinicella indica]